MTPPAGRARTLAVLPMLVALASCQSTPSPSPTLSPTPSLSSPTVECLLNPPSVCEPVLNAARAIVPLDGARVVVTIDRGLAFHADVHACYPDGRYMLVDVMGSPLAASVRPDGWENPPCRAAQPTPST